MKVLLITSRAFLFWKGGGVMLVGAPLHTGIFFFGIDVSDWLALVTLIGVGGGIISRTYKKVLEQSSENNKLMLESFERTNNHNTDMLKIQLVNLSKSLDRINDTFDHFKTIEQEHYTEHEKHLYQHDIDIRQNVDALDDHENRIKNNEDDIDYLKDKLLQEQQKKEDDK